MKHNVKSVLFVLCVMVLLVYGPVVHYDFIKYDDNLYVTNNLHVQGGLTASGLKWAFTNVDAGFWHPLTWLSLMLDDELYGLNAGGYHLTNVLLHLLNTLLLFGVLLRMTGQLGRSGFVAALFAVHPLHVESVAWIAERKDVLSAWFWMLATGAYVLYTERPTLSRYLGVSLLFVLGLMAKPMLVTWPFALLLFDYWPLKRIHTLDRAVVFRLIVEKTPWFMVAILFSAMALYAEMQLGAVPSQADFPMSVRLANALVSYVAYIGKMFWPAGLSFYYPHPGMQPAGHVLLSMILLAVITGWAVVWFRRQPFLWVGWFFYLGTLVPVIGIVQVGGHAMADRYTYLPLIGLFIMLAWGLPEWLRAVFRKGEAFAAAGGIAVLVLLSVLCLFQGRVWQDSLTLFRHAVQVDGNNGKLRHLLGYALMDQGRLAEGIVHFREAVRLENEDSRFHYNLAVALSRSGSDSQAIPSYLRAIEINPLYGEAYAGLGQAYQRLNLYADARHCYDKALARKVNSLHVYNNLALVLFRMGEYEEAEKTCGKAVTLWPDHAGLHHNLAMILKARGRTKEAIAHLRKAVRLQDQYANAHYELGLLLDKEGHSEEAGSHFRKAADINPAYQ
jgi:tetratricopeptide (TPR) repeat protein